MLCYVDVCKSKSGSKYYALRVDLSYRVVTLSVDASVISELLKITLAELYTYEVGTRKKVEFK